MISMFKGDKDEDLDVDDLENLVEDGKVLEDGSEPEDIDIL